MRVGGRYKCVIPSEHVPFLIALQMSRRYIQMSILCTILSIIMLATPARAQLSSMIITCDLTSTYSRQSTMATSSAGKDMLL